MSLTAPTYEIRRRYDDGSIQTTVCATRDRAIDAIVQMIEDGDESDFDCALVIHRDIWGRVQQVHIVPLIEAARLRVRQAAAEARDSIVDPYPQSVRGRAA